MNWIRQLFGFIVLSSLTGTCFSLVWIGVRGLLARHDSKLLYRCLKIVMLFYILPATFIIISFYDSGRAYLSAPDSFILLFDMTPVLFILTETIIIVWSVIVAAMACIRLWDIRKWHEIRRGNIPEEDEAASELFAAVCQRLEIGDKVSLARNDLLTVPVVSGALHPVVILPCVEYTTEELEIIFTHELMHYKRKDLWVKLAALVVAVLHCFNPLSYDLLRSVNCWSEVNCDIAVCQALQGRYSAKAYYELILEQMQRQKDYYIMSAMAEEGSEIMRRVQQMKQYQRENGYGRKKSAALLAAFTAAGLCLSIGVSGMTAKAQGILYRATIDEDKVQTEDTGAPALSAETADVLATASTDGLKQETLPEGAIVEELPFDINPLQRDTRLDINWAVGKDVYLKSKEFKLNEGDKVEISLAFSPADLYMKAGLVYPDLTMKYDDGYGTIGYTFTIAEAGKYRFYIHNPSTTTTVDAAGFVKFITSNY